MPYAGATDGPGGASMARVPTDGINEDLGSLRDHLATIGDLRAPPPRCWPGTGTPTCPRAACAAAPSNSRAWLASRTRCWSHPKPGRLLEEAGEREPGAADAALLRLARRQHDRAVRLAARLVVETSRATALADLSWISARETSDWSVFAPHLQQVLALKREEAGYLDGEHPYDAMLDRYDPGASTKRLRVMFDELNAGIVPLVREVSARLADDRAAKGPLRRDRPGGVRPRGHLKVRLRLEQGPPGQGRPPVLHQRRRPGRREDHHPL